MKKAKKVKPRKAKKRKSPNQIRFYTKKRQEPKTESYDCSPIVRIYFWTKEKSSKEFVARHRFIIECREEDVRRITPALKRGGLEVDGVLKVTNRVTNEWLQRRK